MTDPPSPIRTTKETFDPNRYAILFTDLVNSTKLSDKLGDDDYKANVLFPLLEIQRKAFDAHNGIVSGDPAGDSLMAVFRKPNDAIQAALELLAKTKEWNSDAGRNQSEEVWARVGIHYSEETLHWDDVNILSGHKDCSRAARVMGIGSGGQVVVSEQVKNAQGVSSYDWKAWHGRRFKGLEETPATVYSVGWDHPNAHREPGIAQVPEWIREENRYIARPELENRIIDSFKRQSADKPPFRLVTLHGFGGMGKTRLAVQCSLLMIPAFESKLRFVRLDLLNVTKTTDDSTKRDLLAQEIAAAYGLAGDFAKWENLPQSLPNEKHLLLLDNYETVACKESSLLVTRMIEKNRELYVLVTGRRGVLNDQIEKVIEVDTLDPQKARELFLDRVRMRPTRDNWTPSALDEAAIEEILNLTEGHALSLILVSARAGKKSLTEISKGLKETPFGRETILPKNHVMDADTWRHDSLQLCLDWSWELLDDHDQRALCCLSLFASEFTDEDALKCFPEGGLLAAVTEDHLDHLQDAALLSREENLKIGESFYSMLRPTKEYAQSRLAKRGESNLARDLHQKYFLTLAEKAEPYLMGTKQVFWLNILEREHNNFRAALEHNDPKTKSTESSLKLALALHRFWSVRGYLTEGRKHFARLLLLLVDESQTSILHKAKAYLADADLAFRQGNYVETIQLYKESLTIAMSMQNQRLIASAIYGLGYVALRQGEYARARELCTQSAIMQSECQDMQGRAWSLNTLGIIARDEVKQDNSRSFLNESLSLFIGVNDLHGQAHTIHNLAENDLKEGFYADCSSRLDKSFEIRNALGDQLGIADNLVQRGQLASEQKDYKNAFLLFEESLSIQRQIGDQAAIAWSTIKMAYAKNELGENELAKSLCSAAHDIQKRLGDRLGCAWSLNLFGKIDMDLDDYEGAKSNFTQALELFGTMNISDRQSMVQDNLLRLELKKRNRGTF